MEKNMLISTKGRYALRVMIDLAEHDDKGLIRLQDIADRQQISEKYLESIIAILSKNKFVKASRGKNGGYKLTQAPEKYTIGSILRLTEITLAPVACLENGAKVCDRSAECQTLPMWSKLNDIINDYLNGMTLADLIKESRG